MPAFIFVSLLLGLGAWGQDSTDKDPAATEETREKDDREKEEAKDLTEYVEVNETYVPTQNTIATKLPVPLQDTPSNIGAVSDRLLEEQFAVELGGALENISGINVQGGSGIFETFVIRGFDSLSSSMVMTDGVPEPEVMTYQTYNAEGVEVLKGPSGYLYGINPLAGVVNIVRKQPAPVDFGSFAGSYGSFDTVRGAVDWNQSGMDGDGNFRLNGLWEESSRYRDDKDSSVWAVNPGFAWRLSEDTTLNFNLEYTDAEYSPDSGVPLFNGEIADVPRKWSYQSPFDFSDQTLGRFQVDFESRMSDMLTLRNKTYYRDLDWQTNGTVFNGVFPTGPNFEPEVSRTLTLLDDAQTFYGNQFEAVMTLDGGPVTHQLLTGLEISYLADQYTLEAGLLPSIDLFAPVETATQFPPTFPIDFLDPTVPASADARSVVIAPYVVDQMKLSSHWQVMVGARYDDIDYEDSENDVSRDDSDVSPMLGVVYAPTPTLSFYANGGESFAPASPRVSGDREPEVSDQIEVGAKKQFLEGKVRTTFALYRLDRENIAIPDANGISQQVGDQRSDGFEIEVAAEPIPRLRTFLSYAYTDAELTNFTQIALIGFDGQGQPIFAPVDRSGNTPAFVPKNLGNLWVSYGFRGGFGLGGGVRYIGEQFVGEDNAFALDPAWVVDAMVSYDIKAWRAQLNFRNVTDEEYELRGFGTQSVIPADPASVYFTLGYRF